jgi:hypothetical protein
MKQSPGKTHEDHLMSEKRKFVLATAAFLKPVYCMAQACNTKDDLT